MLCLDDGPVRVELVEVPLDPYIEFMNGHIKVMCLPWAQPRRWDSPVQPSELQLHCSPLEAAVSRP